MKHFTFLITFMAMMFLSFGLAHGSIDLDGGVPSTGYLSGDTVLKGELVTFTFRLTQDAICAMVAFSNGFEVYTTQSVANPGNTGYFDAITGEGTAYDTILIPDGWLYYIGHTLGKFDDVFFAENGCDGKGKDTVGFGGLWLSGKAPGLPVGFSDEVWYVRTTAHTNGDTLCIDSAWFRPNNDWIWSMVPLCDSINFFSPFGGPYCYYVFDTTLDVRTVEGPNLPTTYSLSQNYPNPFNPVTEIHFEIPERSHVTLTVYNVVGQKVATLVDKELMPDRYVVDWEGTSDSGAKVATGVYFYKLQAEGFVETKKMMLLK
jgi:hypothetical protein